METNTQGSRWFISPLWTNQGFIKLTFAISNEETRRLFTFEIFLFFMFKSHLYFLFCELSVHILT